MKRIFLLTLLILILALAFPVVANAEPSVTVTLSSNNAWVGADEPAAMKIDVLNTGTTPITVTSYTVNGITESTATMIDAGSAYRFYVSTPIVFGEKAQKTIISSVSVEELGTVSSNATVLYKKANVPVGFVVDPISTMVGNGDAVDYVIEFKNTGAFDYTDVVISLDGTEIIPAFTCAPGETQTFTYSKKYTQPTEHIFAYTMTYVETDSTTKTSGGVERVLVSVYVPQPTGTLLDGAELMPSVLTAMMQEDTAYLLKLYLKNTSNTDLSGVHVYDANGTDYGGWSKVGIGQTASIAVTLSPVEETIYTFTAYGKDNSGTMRMVEADSVLIAVGNLPDVLVGSSTVDTDPEATQSTDALLPSVTSSKKIYLIIGIVFGIIVLMFLLVILVSASKKTIVRKNRSTKSKKSKNIF